MIELLLFLTYIFAIIMGFMGIGMLIGLAIKEIIVYHKRTKCQNQC